MGQDVTARVSVMGQNPDGTLNIAMQGNPFNVGGATPGPTMVPMQNQAATTYSAMVGNQQINFASEADLLKAKLAIQQLTGGGGAAGLPQLVPGAGGGNSGMGSWLPLAANAGSAINNIFARGNLDRKIKDYTRRLADLAEARKRLEALQSKYADLIPVLLDVNDAERGATETAQSALEDMLSANGVAIGVDVVKVASEWLASNQSGGSIFSGGSSSALLAGGLGLGAGLLASRSSTNNR